MKNSHSLFRSLLAAGLLFLGMTVQAAVVSGTVTDQTGETIISASVVVKGTTLGTVTDFDGNYSLDVPADAVLVFSYIGLVSQEIPVNGQSVINVVLKENAEVLEEVVVTGYGTTKKRDLVTSVASVSADQLKDVPVATAAEALEGKLAGVSVTTAEGSPDADIKIRVRGGTSLTQSNDPLYIVDGFPVSSISDIAPSDIASMDVLKDAAATAIYGAQGANGVIIITTKEIKTDDDNMQIHVDYTGYMGWKKVASKYDMMSGKDFITMQKEYAAMSKNTAIESNMVNNFYKYFDKEQAKHTWYDEEGQAHYNAPALPEIWDQWAGQEIDWQDKTFGLTGMQSNHTFSISGGNKKGNFNLSYNRIDDKGIMYGSDYSRNNFSFKTKFQPLQGLTIALTTRYTNINVIGAGTNTQDDAGSKSESRVRNAVAYSPIPLNNLSSASELSEDAETIGSLYDPITTINDNYRVKKDNKFTIDGYVSYKFLKYFTVKSEFGFETRDQVQNRFYGPTTFYSRNSVTAYTDAGMGNAVITDEKTSRMKNTNSFEYKQTIDEHSLNLFVAQEMIWKKGETRTENAYGFDTKMSGASVFEHLGSAQAYVTNTYVNPNDNMLSFIGRFDYNYRGKYYATLTFRADASTKFSKGNQWGYFPSAAFAWRIIDEDWMAPAQDVVSNMKLRATYGLVGNNNIELGYIHPEYLAYAAANSGLGSTQYYMGGATLIAANENLKWETTTSRNLGLDLGFLNERLSFTLDGYCNSTRDLLLLYRLPDGGYNYQYRNIGSTRNMGIEFAVNAVILDERSKDLSYYLGIGANIAHNNNVVTSLGGMTEYNVSAGCFSSGYANSDYEYKLRVGDRVGNVYGYKVDGMWTTDDFVAMDRNSGGELIGQIKDADGNLKAVSTPMGDARPGMAKIVDTNGDGVLNSDDRVLLGNTQPAVNGGFNLTFNIGGEKWGKVDLGMNFTYSIGNKVLNLSALDYSTINNKTKLRNNLVSNSYGSRYSYLDAEGNFLPDMFAKTDYEGLAAKLSEVNANAKAANPICTNSALTNEYVEDASYLRLSSLTLGYSIPQVAMKKAHMTSCRIFFTASNLFCATKYSGADPEVDARSKNNPLATGVDFSAFPRSRAFNFGLNIGF